MIAATMDYRAAAPKDSGFRSFAEFYPFYLNEHRHPVSRVLHYIGTWGAVLCLVALIVTGEPGGCSAALVSGYSSRGSAISASSTTGRRRFAIRFTVSPAISACGGN